MTSKEEFIKIVNENVKREGIENLLDYLNTNGFYTSPASTKYHGCYEGGLCDHSLNVYYSLLDMLKYIFPTNWKEKYSMESIVIVSLFHDLCKIGKYKKGIKNVKNPNTGVWEQKGCFSYNEDCYTLGHAAKSLHIIRKFINLTDEEEQAIYWHMGPYDISLYSSLNELGQSYTNNTLAFALFQADMMATYVCENPKLQ